MVNSKRLVNRFLELVKIDSETGNEREVAIYIEKILKSLGFSVTYDNANKKFPSNVGNLIARLGDTLNNEALLLSAHMDTVKPGNGVKPYIRDGYIYSDGTTILGGDDKAGIAAILEALNALKENGSVIRPLEIVFCIAEESGLKGSLNLDYKKLNAKYGVVLDSSKKPGSVIVNGPTHDIIDIIIYGKAAHAGNYPEDGINAIQVAASAIARMRLSRVDEDTTANIGTISGGYATNIICPEVTIKAEARSQTDGKLKGQTEHMVKCFKDSAEEFGATIKIEVEHVYDAYDVSLDSKIVTEVVKAMQKISIKPTFLSSNGGSDANNYNKNGIESVNIGIGIEKAHSLEECIEIANLEKTSKIVYNLIKIP